MSLVNQVHYKKKKYKNAPISKIGLVDIEVTTLNRYTDFRVSEMYLACFRYINIKKLYADIKSGKKVDYNNPKVLEEYLEKALFFRTMKELVDFLKEESKNCLMIVYAHNLDFELNYILRETNASTIDLQNGKKSIIARTNNSPIAIVLDVLPRVEFRCSYALTGYSIKTLGEMFGNKEDREYKKLKYNYETIRRATDELKQEDYEYNEQDVVISGLAVIQKALLRKEKIEDLPLTTTSEMNADKEAFIKNNYGDKTFAKMISERKKQLDIIYYDINKLVMDIRQGGLTTLNPSCFNKPIYNVFSADITSSYPYVMCNFRFPRFSLMDKDKLYVNLGKSEEEIKTATLFFRKSLQEGKKNRDSRVKGWLAWVSLTDVEAKTINGKIMPLLPLSEAKCIKDRNKDYTADVELSDIEQINGKIIKASRIDIKINNEDYEQLLLTYNFKVSRCYQLVLTLKESYLNTAEISFLFSQFTEKQKLKPYKEERIAEYMHVKGNINANYGRKQMEIIRPFYYIEDGNFIEVKTDEILENQDAQTFLKKLTKNSLSIDIPSDGSYISSYAKLRLIEMSIELLKEAEKTNEQLGTNFDLNIIYADTDSLKFSIEEKEDEEEDKKGRKKSCFSKASKTTERDKQKNKNIFTNIILKFIENYNENLIKENKSDKRYRFKEYLEKFNISEDDKNIKEILQLGTWDIENRKDKNGNYIPYEYFKSLGAKKYCYKDEEKITTVISGCSTKIGEKIKKYCDDNKLDYIETLNLIFYVNTVFDRSISGRTTSYDEKRSVEEMRKIVVDGKPLIGNGGKMIENTSYTLGVTENDFKYLYNTDEIEEYKRKEEDIINFGVVFLETETGKLVLLTSEEEKRQYFIDSKEIKRDYIYKDFIDGKLIPND